MDKQIQITISTRTIVRVLLVIIGIVGVIVALQAVSGALRLIGLAFFLALALNPSVNFLANRLPGNSRILATSVSYLAVVSILSILLFSTIPIMFRETSQFINSLPQYLEESQQDHTPLGGLIDRYGIQDSISQGVNEFRQNTGQLAGYAFNSVGKITDSIISLVTVLVLTFLMLIEAPRWQERFWAVYQSKSRQKRHKGLAMRMYRVVTGYVNGQVVIAAIAATGTLIALLVLGIVFDIDTSTALPLAGIIFITGLVPMVGALIGGILVALFLALYSLPAALIFAIYFTAYQQLENYVMQPLIQSRALELSALVVFASAIIGFSLMGPIGGFVAIPVAGCIRVLLDDYLEQRQKNKPIAKSSKKAPS